MTLLKLQNPYLKKIINVYQPTYKNLVAQGLGDYLRGCFCLFQICKMHGLEFDMDLSHHPMYSFLKNKFLTDNQNSINRNNISWFPNPNYIPTGSSTYRKDSLSFHNEFIKHINNVQQKEYFLFCNSFPIFNFIHDIARYTIREKILPVEELKKEVDMRLEKMGLTKKNFSVIHIRTGDSYLLENKSLDPKLIYKIVKITNPYLYYRNKHFLILSDNAKIKLIFSKYHNCKFNLKEATHLGENAANNEEKIKNTLVDFYIMGYANLIISLSPYTWGSGFSQWCSVMNKIPYKSFRI
jgi:hypothetical protein